MIFVLFALQQTFAGAQPLTSHPRLFVRGSDMPTLRSWAVVGNPVYQNGLLPLATGAKADMDSGAITTSANGGPTYVTYPEEMYSELFAFMSLISADQPTRDDYAQRARTLLMYVMNQAVAGASAGQPYRDPAFSVNDRSRWWGEGFPLTVDWIYPYLTAADKATIRTVFLRWIGEDINATDHPLPLGVVNSSVLLQSRQAVRFSGNNYYTAHMRNIGLMAASFDAADDPGNTLRNYLGNATGAWLYVLDNLMRTDAAGGLMPEGFEYSPQTMGYIVQLLLALKSAGLDDPATYGQQAVLTSNPFWDQIIPAYLHSLSPVASSNQDAGQVYLPAWYGDGQDYYAPDYIWTFGPLAVYDRFTANTARPSQIRWIETNLAPGGPAGFAGRTRNTNFFMNAVYYFLLYDPAAPASSDPRPALDTSFFAPGLGRILARTGWDSAASWFTYKLSFNQVNHQTSDGNQIEFYRNGEWLTKQRVGYFLDDESSINANTLTLQNSPIQRDPTDYRTIEDQLGSQWAYVSAGDPVVVAQDLTTNFVFMTGDSTNLYNSTNEGATDILHASRSVIWIKPDYLVIYDRAASQTANRFKRFWLNLPSLPTISGKVATAVTTGGQSLFVSSLLPAASTLSGSQATVIAGSVANFEPMGYRLEVEATGNPLTARFLHVLQGANAGQVVSTAVLVQSSSGTAYDGVAVAGNAVLFPANLTDAFAGTAYSAPTSATLHRVTGLSPGAGYTVTTQAGGQGVQVRIAAGGPRVADSGGVLEFTVSTAPLTAQSITFGQPAAITLPSGGIPLTASATSGLAVAFTSNTLPVCTAAGATVTPIGTGTCSITASQAGNSTYSAATPVTQTFAINLGSQTITFAAPAAIKLPAPAFALAATSSAGLAVSFSSNSTGVCVVGGTTLTPVSAGTCSITAAQGGDSNYAPAASVTRTFTINPVPSGGSGGGGGGGTPLPSSALAANPTALTFNVPAGNAPSSQIVTLVYQTYAQGAVPFSASATTNQGLGWLSLLPSSGTLTQVSYAGFLYTDQATATITVNPAGLTAGTVFTGNVNFSAGGAIASVPVTVNVVAQAPVVRLAPSSLTFTYRQGDAKNPDVQTFGVSGTPSGTGFGVTTSGGSWLSASPVQSIAPAQIQVSVNPASLLPGTYAGKVTVSPAGGTPVDESVTLNVIRSDAPAISAGGVAPLYSSSNSIQAGSWISIYGTNLAATTATWNGDFPTSLGGVSVKINNKPAYLWFVSPSQLNVQAPDDTATGTVSVSITNSNGTANSTVTLGASSPSFSLFGDGKHLAAAIITPDGSGAYGGGTYDLAGPTGAFSFTARPVRKGESLILYGVGFGPTNPKVPAGGQFTGAAPLISPVSITIGGVTANVSFAGITAAGLYQFNVTVPDAGSGDKSVVATVAGQTTAAGPVIAIQ